TLLFFAFFFQAEDGIRVFHVTGVQTCALPICLQYRHIDRFLAIGSKNDAYYRAYGVPAERIFRVPFSVDNARFASGSRLSAEEQIGRASCREREWRVGVGGLLEAVGR